MRTKRLIIARERNVVRVDFRRKPEPPSPKFPGAAALRALIPLCIDAHIQAKVA